MSKDPHRNPIPRHDPGDPLAGTHAGDVAPDAGTGDVAPVPRPETGPAGDAGTGNRRPAEAPTGTRGDPMRVTRSGVMWTATVLALVLLVLLIIFIAQNTNTVGLRYFGLEGDVQLGLALFVAAVGGGIVVAIAGAARIIQLRAIARKDRPRKRQRK